MTCFATSPDRARIAYDCTGEGRPIILIHGFTANRTSWAQTGWVENLVYDGFRVITFDVRGHGESDKPHEPSAYGPRLADDVCAVLDAADAPQADLFGYSMGGHLAIMALVERPERLARAVIGGVGDLYFTRDPAWCARTADALEAKEETGVTDWIARLHRKYAIEGGNDRLALAAFMRSKLTYPADALKRITHPVLVFCGEKDNVSGRAKGLAEAFANGRALTVRGRNHMTALGEPLPGVLEFLRPS